MDGADILAVLGRMNKSSDDPIDLNTAMEIAAREGAEAVLHGRNKPNWCRILPLCQVAGRSRRIRIGGP